MDKALPKHKLCNYLLHLPKGFPHQSLISLLNTLAFAVATADVAAAALAIAYASDASDNDLRMMLQYIFFFETRLMGNF